MTSRSSFPIICSMAGLAERTFPSPSRRMTPFMELSSRVSIWAAFRFSAPMAKSIRSATEKAVRMESSVVERKRDGTPAAWAAATAVSPPMIRSAPSATASLAASYRLYSPAA